MPRKRLFHTNIPQLRSADEGTPRQTTWTELLNDLVFTVIIQELASRLLNSIEGPAFGQFIFLYVPVWWLWNGETHYSTRFDNEQDVVHRFLVSLQLLGLLVLAATIPNTIASNWASELYALTYVFVRSVLLIEYGRAYYYVPRARPYIRYIVTGFSVSVIIWFVSVYTPAPYRYVLWSAGILIELATPLTSSGGKMHRTFPPDVRHLPERYGLFTLLVLGQSVTGTTLGLIDAHLQPVGILTAVFGGIIIIGLWWAYFDRLDDDAVRHLGEGGSPTIYAFWLYLHLPLTIALTLVGVGLTYVIKTSDETELTNPMRWLLAGSVAGYLLTEAGISLTTLKAGPPHPGFIWGIAIRAGVAVILVLLVLLFSLNAVWLMGVTATLVIGLIISDYLLPDPPKSEERVNSEK